MDSRAYKPHRVRFSFYRKPISPLVSPVAMARSQHRVLRLQEANFRNGVLLPYLQSIGAQ
jgi:hypothetical protein